MVDVPLMNLDRFKNEIETSLKSAAFISIDTEYTGLVNSPQKYNFTYFDETESLYNKLKKNIDEIIAVQVGLSVFQYNSDESKYYVSVYRFYIFPSIIVDNKFTFQSSSIQFLSEYNFDFNKLIYNGLPYLLREEEDVLKQLLERNQFVNYIMNKLSDDLVHKLDEEYNRVRIWEKKAALNDTLVVKPTWPPNMIYILNFCLQLIVKSRLQSIWTKHFGFESIEFEKNKKNENKSLVKPNERNLNEDFLFKLRGFNNIFQLLVECKKPLVGHNMLFDLAIMYKQFYEPLPKSYHAFKKNIHELFPAIYDTKCISYGLITRLNKNVRWKSNNLNKLYEFLKTGSIRKMLVHSSQIIGSNITVRDISFHDAAFDSYITGFVFVQLAHVSASVSIYGSEQVLPKLTNTQYFRMVDNYKNLVHIGRSKARFMNFEGAEPSVNRPPLLYVSRKDGNNIDLPRLEKMLKRTYRSCDVHELSQKAILLAVPEFDKFHRILDDFENDKVFCVIRYRPLRHSPVLRNTYRNSILAVLIALIFYIFGQIVWFFY